MIHALALTGPTASGKTALSINIARALGCEIISLDSMQIYKGMDIGTAKATKEEQLEIPHHMIDFLAPNEPFSAVAYRDAAMKAARDIEERGKIPFFVGGTGLYLSVLMRADGEQAPESDPEYRTAKEAAVKTEEDRISLWQRLESVDPSSAELIHYNNVRRVIRALEVYDRTGKTKSYFDALSAMGNQEIEIRHVTLDFRNRDVLYKRVDERVDIMIERGLEDEVKELLSLGFLSADTTAAQAIGYKELALALQNNMSTEQAVEQIKQASRNYAKRQLTWFRHMDGAKTVYVDSEDGSLKNAGDLLAECLHFFKISKQ